MDVATIWSYATCTVIVMAVSFKLVCSGICDLKRQFWFKESWNRK